MNKEETIKDIQNIINANCWTISEHFASNVANALYSAGYGKVEEGNEELKACNEKQVELETEIEMLKKQNAIAYVFLGEIFWCIENGQDVAKNIKERLQTACKSAKQNELLNEMQERCDLDLDLEEFKNFKQIRNKLADTETNLAIAQDDRKFLKKENARLSVENTALKQQLADLQANTAEAIGGIYKGHFSAQEQFAIYVMREIEKIFAPFISIDDNDTEN